MLGLQVSPPQFPVLGNGLPLAILFLLHITIAEFSVGAITLAVGMEWRSVSTGDPWALRYARAAANSFYLVFSLGATLAVFAVVLLTGLWGNVFGQIVNSFIPLVAFAFGLFFVLVPLLVWYRNSFGRMDARNHAILGTSVAVFQTLFVVLIVGIDAYLITPFNSGLLAATLNPPYWPLLIHRLIGNVSWTALFFAAYAAVKMRGNADDRERAFQAWAARVNLRIGLGLALLMPVDGFALIVVLHNTQAGFFDNLVSGGSAWMMVLQEAFVAVVLIGGNVALEADARGDGAGRSTLGTLSVPITAAGMTIACLPAAVLPSQVLALRYVGLGIAVVVTAAHLVARLQVSRERALQSTHAPGLVAARRALVTVGVFSLATALLMGVIKEHARGSFALYGELTQAAAQQQYNPPGNLYP